MVAGRAHGCRCETTAKGPFLPIGFAAFVASGQAQSRLWPGRRRIVVRRSSGGTQRRGAWTSQQELELAMRSARCRDRCNTQCQARSGPMADGLVD